MKHERRGWGAVAFSIGRSHRYYEDRYRLLTRDIPMVQARGRGEIYAVFDGIGGAPKGREAAQEMSDALIRFFAAPETYPCSPQGVHDLLMDANLEVYRWGMMPGTDRSLGGCAGTIRWILDDRLFTFHAGDTAAIHIRDGRSRQLTRFHEAGKVMYRYFGLGQGLEIDMDETGLEESDRVLLVSDGVTKVFHPVDAAGLIEQFTDIGKAATELVRRSIARGSMDDITVLLVEIEELP